jgi:hypothetical protein
MDDRKLQQWLDDENTKPRTTLGLGTNEANTVEPLFTSRIYPGSGMGDNSFEYPFPTHFDGQQFTIRDEPVMTITMEELSEHIKKIETFEQTIINTDKIKSDGGSSSYYELPDGAKELQDLIEHRNMNFAIGNIFKACYRKGRKSGVDAIYDINKIIWYAEREKARLERELDNGSDD